MNQVLRRYMHVAGQQRPRPSVRRQAPRPKTPMSKTARSVPRAPAVLDGAAIAVARVGRGRLLGIDAPEMGRGFDTAAPFAHEARDRLTSFLLHRWVHLEQEGTKLDAYNRHLAYVVRDDGMFV